MDSGNAFAHFPCSLWILHLDTFGTFFPLGFISKCHLHVSVGCHWVSLASAIGMCIYCMQFLPWWFNNDLLEIERSELDARREFLGISERRSRPKEEKSFSDCLLTSKPTRPRLMKENSVKVPALKDLLDRPFDLGTVELAESAMRNPRVRCKLVALFGRCLQMPEASRFLPGAPAGPASLFERIQRRENAEDGPGRRHPGAGRGSSQRSSRGHPWCRAGEA